MVVDTTSNGHMRIPDGDVAPFSGLACSWQVNTRGYRISPDAVVRTLRAAELDRKQRGGSILWPVLAEHNPKQAFGWISLAQITEDGLYVEGYLDGQTPECHRVLKEAKDKDGDGNGLSLGFKAIAEHMEGNVRVLDEIEIYEISVGAGPVDLKARLTVGSFNESEYAIMRAIAQEQESESKMGTVRYIDDEEFERPLRGGSRADYEPFQEPDKPYRIKPGEDPQESRVEFERELRKELRESDPDLYTLTPGGKAQRREVEKRQQERAAKQKAQQEALEADRKAIADRQAAMSAETFNPESFAAASGLDVGFVRKWFNRIVSSGATPVDGDGLVLRAQDVRAAAKRDFELIEIEANRMRNKRLEGAA